PPAVSFCFFHVPATPAMYTLSLHDALPISQLWLPLSVGGDASGNSFDLDAFGRLRPSVTQRQAQAELEALAPQLPKGVKVKGVPDRKSTRLNSSHRTISYAVFCLKKKNTIT